MVNFSSKNNLFNDLFSIETVKVYKPDSKVYNLPVQKYKIKPQEVSIVQGIAAVYYSLNDMEKHVEYMNILKDLESNSAE